LLSGKSSTSAGCYEVINGKFLNQVNLEEVDFDPPDNILALPEGCLILPEYLKSEGYNTGFFGKWHVGSGGAKNRGFDDYVTLKNLSHWNVSNSFINSSPDYLEPEGYSSDYLTSCVKRFLGKYEKSKKPFFIYLAHTLVQTI
jgi:arylsulfatase A-like enzyme